MAVTFLSSETKLTTGTITVPSGCDFIVALVWGSELPPVVNAIAMTPKASVAAAGDNPAISLHVMPVDIAYTYGVIVYGSKAVFLYLQNGVCCRPDVIRGYSTSGTVSGTLETSSDDLAIGMVVGNNGQVTLTLDGTALTLELDEVKRRGGHLSPGDSSQAVSAHDPGTVTGQYVEQPRYWVDTTTTVLVTPGHYEQQEIKHVKSYAYMTTVMIGSLLNDKYQVYVDGVPSGVYYVMHGDPAPTPIIWYTYVPVWIDPVYEERPSGYWVYPDPVWVESGTPGQVSAIVVSIADVMIGGEHIPQVIVG